ncbi:MAG: SUMF1/EgtB/PvdO family nonheme iron enzyme [Candidatus Sedimenticola sp. (ex Thyasira tokunagai)]
MNCSSCSYILPSEDSLFCPHCGEKLEKEDCCGVCGKPYLPNANFCDRCGSPVERAKAPDQQLFAEPQGEEDDHRGKVYHTREVALGIVYEDWALIHGGEFVMGSPVDELYRFDYERQHQVQINSFELMKTPVTFAMYDAYCDVHDIVKPRDEGWGRGNRPAINISYWDAIDYCSWLRKVTGWKIRLTTEAEWEYACRAGTGTPFSTGESISSDQANFDGTFIYGKGERGIKRGMTTPVGQFAPNLWGLYDMHGNVWEWCSSEYENDYNGLEQLSACRAVDNHNPRVVRGGSWYNVPGSLRSASRNKLAPDLHFLKVGFRIVREIK